MMVVLSSADAQERCLTAQQGSSDATLLARRYRRSFLRATPDSRRRRAPLRPASSSLLNFALQSTRPCKLSQAIGLATRPLHSNRRGEQCETDEAKNGAQQMRVLPLIAQRGPIRVGCAIVPPCAILVARIERSEIRGVARDEFDAPGFRFAQSGLQGLIVAA